MIVVIDGISVNATDICAFENERCDMRSDNKCLAVNYACGRYETIVSTLYAESFAPTVVQKYYIGASLYGMYVQSRAKSLECEFAKAANEYLTDFLQEKEMRFQESGQFGTTENMNQIYHATQLLNDLKNVEGCLESALTRSRVIQMSRAFAFSDIKSVFLSPTEESRGHMDSLNIMIRSLVSKASEIETGLSLRDVEVESGRRYLNNVMDIFRDIFGEVEVRRDGGLNVNLQVLRDLSEKSALYLRDSKRHEDSFKRALGGVTPEEYANLRTNNIILAEEMLKKSAFAIDLVGVLLPSPMDVASPLWQLANQVNQEDEGRMIGKVLVDIRQDWKDYGVRQGHCRGNTPVSSKPWYCR